MEKIDIIELNRCLALLETSKSKLKYTNPTEYNNINITQRKIKNILNKYC